jgi:hypothetical protein
MPVALQPLAKVSLLEMGTVLKCDGAMKWKSPTLSSEEFLMI